MDDFAALVHPQEAKHVLEAVHLAVEECKAFSQEFRIVRPSGEVRWIATNGRVLYDPAGQPVRMLEPPST